MDELRNIKLLFAYLYIYIYFYFLLLISILFVVNIKLTIVKYNRKLNRKKGNLSRDLAFENMIDEITKEYDNSNKQAHVLVELDKRQFERYKTNSIILYGLKKRNNQHPYYSSIEIGENLKLSKQNHDGYIFDMIRLLIIKKQFFLILGVKQELELYVEKLFCYPCNNSFYIKENKNKKEILSGYVILMIGKITNIQKSSDDFWDEEFEEFEALLNRKLFNHLKKSLNRYNDNVE